MSNTVLAQKRKRVRDVYGNWVSEDAQEGLPSEYGTEDNVERASKTRRTLRDRQDSEQQETSQPIDLDWRDYIALTIASLQTVLLPIVILILVILGIVAVLAFIR